jgi:hypothetical protein
MHATQASWRRRSKTMHRVEGSLPPVTAKT